MDKIYECPDLRVDIVCITDNFVLAAQFSSYFNIPNQYIACLEQPRSFHKFWESEFTMLNNCLARFKPKKIVFIGVRNKMILAIKKKLKIDNSIYRYVNKNSDIRRIAEEHGCITNGEIRCPADGGKILFALLDAKKNKKKLVVDNHSNYEPPEEIISSNHLIVTDSTEDINPVVTANYAFAVNAHIKLINGIDDHTPSAVMYATISDSDKDGSRGLSANKIKEKVEINIRDQVKEFQDYKLITFFTKEFQYGYFFPEIVTTHIPNRLLVSYYIINSIMDYKRPIKTALLVDTGFFKNSETDHINDLLSKEKIFIKELLEGKFKNFDLDSAIQYFPYDLLFICSHAGFPPGQRLKINYKDKNNLEHLIEIDTLDTFDVTDVGSGLNTIVDVKTFYEFVSFDGEPWYNKKFKKGSSKTAIEDFINLGRNKWTVVSKKKIKNMQYCNVIQTKDKLGPYLPMIQGLPNPLISPVVFNNACASTYSIANNFLFAGVKHYIGTLKKVLIVDAVNIAKGFFDKSVTDLMPLCVALWKSQQENSSTSSLTYVSIGCHFNKFVFNDVDQYEVTKKYLKLSLIMAYRGSSRVSPTSYAKTKHDSSIRYLENELSSL